MHGLRLRPKGEGLWRLLCFFSPLKPDTHKSRCITYLQFNTPLLMFPPLLLAVQNPLEHQRVLLIQINLGQLHGSLHF